MVWDVQQQRWEKYFAALKAYKGAYGDVDIKKDYVDPQGIALGNWVYNLRGYRASGLRLSYLTEERIRQLDELGFIWSKVDSQWEMNFQAAQDYYRKHGDLEVPAAYISPDGLKLGVWLQSVRYNRKKPGKGKPLTERQIATLDAIGMNWTGKLDRSFANGMVHAQEYFRANGDLNVTRSCCSPDGFRLGEWVANQRERYRRGSCQSSTKRKWSQWEWYGNDQIRGIQNTLCWNPTTKRTATYPFHRLMKKMEYGWDGGFLSSDKYIMGKGKESILRRTKSIS